MNGFVECIGDNCDENEECEEEDEKSGHDQLHISEGYNSVLVK